ncbi:MAG: type VI secretion system baseplate subunit TssG [Kiritimatiellaeota bacterium]|nr:type VI secretion system baseplate subunit TssG [Kiritimatiellota bacterium]
METTNRKHADYLIRRLCREATDYDFFQAVRLLEQAHGDKPRVGRSLRVSDDLLRFGQTPTLEFAPSTISAFVAGTHKPAPTMFVYFLGLLGPNGALPLFLTEFVRNRERNNSDSTQNRFLDIFNNRIIALFYRAWALNSQAVSYDRPEDDWVSLAISCIAGYGDETLKHRDSVPDAAKSFFSGLMATQSVSEEGLTSILSGFFQIPVKVSSFTPRWLRVSSEYFCRLGAPSNEFGGVVFQRSARTAENENSELGGTAMLGKSYRDRTQRFTIHLGPLDFDDFERLLPGAKSFTRLMDWVRNYLTDPLCWDIRFTLKADAVPKTRLGGYGRLGYSTWLKAISFENDAEYPRLDSESKYLTRMCRKAG